jgi:hypothetical protein
VQDPRRGRAAGGGPGTPPGSREHRWSRSTEGALAPILLGTGRKASEVAPAALASTFVTSVAGVTTFTILALYEHGSVAPAWPTGIALGVGGLAGAYTGARFQSRMPDALIRRLMGILVIAIGAQYLWSGLSGSLFLPCRPRSASAATGNVAPVG